MTDRTAIGFLFAMNRIDQHMQRYRLDDDRPNKETNIEQLMRMALDLAGLDYNAQGHVGRYRPDFMLCASPVIIECDGPVHLLPRQQQKDRKKDAAYLAAGYRVYRYTHIEIQQSAIGCVQSLLDAEKAHAATHRL